MDFHQLLEIPRMGQKRGVSTRFEEPCHLRHDPSALREGSGTQSSVMRLPRMISQERWLKWNQ